MKHLVHTAALTLLALALFGACGGMADETMSTDDVAALAQALSVTKPAFFGVPVGATNPQHGRCGACPWPGNACWVPKWDGNPNARVNEYDCQDADDCPGGIAAFSGFNQGKLMAVNHYGAINGEGDDASEVRIFENDFTNDNQYETVTFISNTQTSVAGCGQLRLVSGCNVFIDTQELVSDAPGGWQSLTLAQQFAVMANAAQRGVSHCFGIGSSASGLMKEGYPSTTLQGPTAADKQLYIDYNYTP